MIKTVCLVMVAATIAAPSVLDNNINFFEDNNDIKPVVVASQQHRRNPLMNLFPKFDQVRMQENNTGPALFLSPLITAGKIAEAQKRAYSRFDLPLSSVDSYSGYLTVNKPACKSNMFFWFFPAKNNPSTAPVVLWLQGGPGGSSMFGLFVEHGPFRVTKGMKLEAREQSWAATHNMIYIDNPVGTGYSFTEKDECFATDQEGVANDLYDALRQFFLLFPHLQTNDFFVTGESYAGKYVPAISYKIHKVNTAAKPPKPKINFKGMAIGDGLCDPVTMTNYGDLLFNIGLIDERDRDYFKKVAKLQVQAINSKKWMTAFQLFDELLNGDLSGHPSYFHNVTGYDYYFNYAMTKTPTEFERYPKFIQTADVRRAIHVGNRTYNDGVAVEKHLLLDVMKSVKPWIAELLDYGQYRIMFFNGQWDIIIGWPLTENFLTSIKWKGAKKYLEASRQKWHVDDELAGYAKQVGNFTTVLVRNAGHMVPFDQPVFGFDLISRFTSGKGFK